MLLRRAWPQAKCGATDVTIIPCHSTRGTRMKQALTIGHNDLRLFFRHRASWVWLLVMPIAFTYFMGFAVRGPGGPNSPRPAIFIENRDEGFLSRSFLEALGQQGLRVVASTNRDDAKRGIRIPADFTQRVLNKQRVNVEFITVEGGGNEAAALVAINAYLVEHAVSTAGKAPTEEGLRALNARENPVRLESRFAGRKPMPVGFNLSLPGNVVMYVLMNLMIFGGTTVATERRYGVLPRLMVHPVNRGTLIVGKVYGLILLGWVQIAVMLLASRSIRSSGEFGRASAGVAVDVADFCLGRGVARRAGRISRDGGGKSSRRLPARQLADGGAGRMLVAAGNRAGLHQGARASGADRLGHGRAASTHHLRRRFCRSERRDGRPVAFPLCRQYRRREMLSMVTTARTVLNF